MRGDFYPRPPRGGRRRAENVVTADTLFLSTPSARRATFFRCTSCWIDTISIHALREEGDILRGIGQWRNSDFYPRPPRGGRLLFRCHLQRLFCISIHALREEGDRKRHRAVGTDTNFYPRPPRGGRLEVQRLLANASVISIHALREEGDNAITAKETPQNNFYPRPPRGGRRISTIHRKEKFIFLSTPSARRATGN